MSLKHLKAFCLGLSVATAAPVAAQAPAYPSHPVELIVPYAPGGASDIIARSIAPYLQKELGVSIVVTNRAGANTAIAASYLARASNDGYTFMLADVALVLNSAIRTTSPGYDPINDFKAVGMLGTGPFVLFVPGSGSATLADFLAKGKQGRLNIANAGPGSLGHLGAELLRLKTGLDIVSIPYKGSGPAMNETMSGQVDATFGSTASGMGLVKSGELRALAVASPTPITDYPAIPTFDQLGIAGVHVLNWWGVIAPKGIEQAKVDRMFEALGRIAVLPEVQARFKALGVSPSLRSPAAYADTMKKDLALWRGVVRDAKIKVD